MVSTKSSSTATTSSTRMKSAELSNNWEGANAPPPYRTRPSGSSAAQILAPRLSSAQGIADSGSDLQSSSKSSFEDIKPEDGGGTSTAETNTSLTGPSTSKVVKKRVTFPAGGDIEEVEGVKPMAWSARDQEAAIEVAARAARAAAVEQAGESPTSRALAAIASFAPPRSLSPPQRSPQKLVLERTRFPMFEGVHRSPHVLGDKLSSEETFDLDKALEFSGDLHTSTSRDLSPVLRSIAQSSRHVNRDFGYDAGKSKANLDLGIDLGDYVRAAREELTTAASASSGRSTKRAANKPKVSRQLSLYDVLENLRALTTSVKASLSEEESRRRAQDAGLGAAPSLFSFYNEEAGGSQASAAHVDLLPEQSKNARDCVNLDEKAGALLQQASLVLGLSDFMRKLSKLVPQEDLFVKKGGTGNTDSENSSSSEQEEKDSRMSTIDFEKIVRLVRDALDRNRALTEEFEKQASQIRNAMLDLVPSNRHRTELEEKWDRAQPRPRSYRDPSSAAIVLTGPIQQPTAEELIHFRQQQVHDVLDLLTELHRAKMSAHQCFYDVLPATEKRKLYAHLSVEDRRSITNTLSTWEFAELQKTGVVAVQDGKEIPPTLVAQVLTSFVQRTCFNLAKDVAGKLPDEYISPTEREALSRGALEILQEKVLPKLVRRADACRELELLVLHGGLLSRQGTSAVNQELVKFQVSSGMMPGDAESGDLDNLDPLTSDEKDGPLSAQQMYQSEQITRRKARLILRRAADEAKDTSVVKDRLLALLDPHTRSMVAEEHAPSLLDIVDALEKSRKAKQHETSTVAEEKKRVAEISARRQQKIELLENEMQKMRIDLQASAQKIAQLEVEVEARENVVHSALKREREEKFELQMRLRKERAEHVEFKTKSNKLLDTLNAANLELSGRQQRASEHIDAAEELRRKLREDEERSREVRMAYGDEEPEDPRDRVSIPAEETTLHDQERNSSKISSGPPGSESERMVKSTSSSKDSGAAASTSGGENTTVTQFVRDTT
ncbi:unnamed protein product [Amoebophrya sp. A25]|nr:unnamed protein product [Amoebophrya sp. A25]|eukprot:GSA25T00007595001.1